MSWVADLVANVVMLDKGLRLRLSLWCSIIGSVRQHL